MAETITPVVHGGNRRRWGVAVTLHTFGAVFAAGAFGAVLGGLGMAAGGPWPVAGPAAVAAVAVLYGARELFGLPVPVPERRRQVPEHWRWTYGPYASSFLYGLGLGIGFLTHVRFGTLVAVAAVAVAAGDPLAGAVVVGGFGLARGLSLAVVAGARTAELLRSVSDRLDGMARSRGPKLLNGAVLAALAVAAALAALVEGGGRIGPLLAAALAAVFAWASGAKVLDLTGWRASLEVHRLGPLRRPAAVAVPLAESSVAALVVLGASGAAAWAALGLLAAFSGAILRARAIHGDRLPCGCFGRTRARDFRALLARNVLLAGLAAAVLVTGAGFPLLAWSRPPGAGEVIPALLVVLGLGATAWLARKALTTLRDQPG